MEAVDTHRLPEDRSLSRTSPRPVWWWLGTFGGAFLGCVLLVAVWGKMLDPMAFVEQIHSAGLDFLLPAQAMALLALAIEAAFGIALLLGVRRLWVLVPASLLVALFLSLTGHEWWQAAHGLRSESASCGCFGNLVQRTPSQAFWQDLGLLVPALLLAWVGRERAARFPRLRTLAAVVGALAVAVFAWKSPALPLDDLATRLRPGAVTKGFCAGAGDSRICLDSIVPELKTGRHLVVMAKLDDPQFTKAVDALNRYAGDAHNPTLWVLSPITPEEKRAFFWKWGPAFEIRETPQELLRPLYRRLPRSFMVEDGKVTRTFGGLPPPLTRSERSST